MCRSSIITPSAAIAFAIDVGPVTRILPTLGGLR
jgi:hypothetical protein